MKSSNSKKGKKRKGWEVLNKQNSFDECEIPEGEGIVNKWILDNLRINNKNGLLRPFPSIGMVGIMGNLPQGLPMTDSEIVDGRAILGGDFEHYKDSWRIVCVRVMLGSLAIVILIDGTETTEIRRRSYENGFNWNKWLGLQWTTRKGNIDGYYLIVHEKRRGMYLGHTWSESLIKLNGLFRWD
jgi:hypothetical protein